MDDADRRLVDLLADRPDAEASIFTFLQAGRWPSADVVRILADRPGGLDRYLDSLLRARRHVDAEAVLRAMLAVDAEERNALSRLGDLLLRTGDLPGADDLAVRLVGAHPAAPDGWLLMGRVAQARDQHLEAYTLFREAAARGPDSTAADLGVLRSLLFLGREEEFEAVEKRLESKVGRSVAARAELLRLQASHDARMGKHAAALDALDRAERLIPRDVSIVVARAYVRRQAGDPEGAKRELHRALSMDPSNREAKAALDALEGVTPTAPSAP